MGTGAGVETRVGIHGPRCAWFASRIGASASASPALHGRNSRRAVLSSAGTGVRAQWAVSEPSAAVGPRAESGIGEQGMCHGAPLHHRRGVLAERGTHLEAVSRAAAY